MHIRRNADMTAGALREFCTPSEEVARPLRAAVDQFGLSARPYDRILEAARTIADLEGGRRLATVTHLRTWTGLYTRAAGEGLAQGDAGRKVLS
jgi:predicted ATPase with chaperone activity